MYCLGCGIDLTSKVSDRRNLRDSNDVILLCKTFMNHVADETDEDRLLESAGLMCRKCYYAYKKYIGLQDSLEESLCKSLQQLHTYVKKPRLSASSGSKNRQVQPVIVTAGSTHSSISPDVYSCTVSVPSS